MSEIASEAYQNGFHAGYALGLQHGREQQVALQGIRRMVPQPRARKAVAAAKAYQDPNTHANRLRRLLHERNGQFFGELKSVLGVECARKAYKLRDVRRDEEGRFWLMEENPGLDHKGQGL